MFLHGYLSDKNVFFKQIPFFERDFNVYALDLKGFGENKDMPYPYSLNDYVEEVKEFCNKNGIVKPNVVAHSFGGRITLKLAYNEPDFFNKIVLVDSAGLKPKRNFKYVIKKISFNVLKLLVKKEYLKSFYSKDYLALNGVMQESFKLIVNESLDYTLKGIKNETFIVFGKNDKDTPLYMAEKLRKEIKNSQLKIIDNAGHFCFLDKPITFNTEVREFLLK